MLIPWTTWTAASAVVQVATAFYPYDPSSGEAKPTRAQRTTPGLRDAPRRRLTIPLRRVPRDNTYDILNSEDPKQKNSVAVDQDGDDLSYMAAVTIGSSEEEYHLLLDSAASNTWVMGQECKAEACGKHNTFGEGDSDTLKTTSKSFSITYGTGSVSGTTAKDTIHIAGVSTPLTFGLASNVSQEFNAYPMDGILGLGRGTASSLADSPQLIDTLAAADLIPAKLYGIHLSRAADGIHDGELNLGEVNTDRFDGDLNWLDTVPNDTGFWEVRISDAGAGGSLAGLSGKSAIIDTGTSYVFMPAPDAVALHKLIEGSSQSGESFSVPCATTTDLQIKFGDATYAVSAKDWVGGTTGGGLCRSNVFGRQTFGDDQWLLGDVFLKNVYAAFDLDNGKVGFGTKTDAEESASSTSTSKSKSASASASASASDSPSTLQTTSTAPILPPGASATPTSSPLDTSAASKDQTGASSSTLPASLLTLFCIAASASFIIFA
ncbi:acid protease [Karstenula rhodostoma CBS 690.94]|uniref:Acid protease n=1 Tax=Karstenula rhodostoma CBS 690.94 TaxID=1392251 RepID=A0A9P4PEC2_9PLEO|nr:acid protease [Karstenula rhodostoma CBS 690.94]